MNKFLDLESVEWINAYIEENLKTESIDLNTFFGERYKLITTIRKVPIYAFINKNGVIEVDNGMKKLIKAMEASKYGDKIKREEEPIPKKRVSKKKSLSPEEIEEKNELLMRFSKLNQIELYRLGGLLERHITKKQEEEFMVAERERLRLESERSKASC